MSNGTNVRISTDTHSNLIEHLKNTERKVGKWTEMAIAEKIKRETKK